MVRGHDTSQTVPVPKCASLLATRARMVQPVTRYADSPAHCHQPARRYGLMTAFCTALAVEPSAESSSSGYVGASALVYFSVPFW